MTDYCPTPEDPNSQDVLDLFPEDSQPEDRTQSDCDPICAIRPSRLLMTGLLLEFYKLHFSNPAGVMNNTWRTRLENPAFGAWAPNNPKGLLIQPLDAWDPATTGKRPAILVQGDDWTFESTLVNESLARDVYTGETFHQATWRGSHHIFCLAEGGTECEGLADEVMHVFLCFATLLREEWNAMLLRPAAKSKLFVVAEQRENCGIDVSCTYAVTTAFALRPEAPIAEYLLTRAAEFADNCSCPVPEY